MKQRGLVFRRIRGTGRQGNAPGLIRSIRCLVCLAVAQADRYGRSPTIQHVPPCPEAKEVA